MTIELLNDENAPDTSIVASFALEQLTLKKDLIWYLKVSVRKILPKTYHYLDITFDLDQEPYERRINRLTDQIDEIERDTQLFPDEQRKDAKRFDKLIADVRKELRELEKECPDINTTGAIQEIKYKDGSTVLVMTIPPSTAFELDEQKLRLGHYKITIRPDFNE